MTIITRQAATGSSSIAHSVGRTLIKSGESRPTFRACIGANPIPISRMRPQGGVLPWHPAYDQYMNALFIIIIIVAIVLAIVGGLVEAVNFLLWVGIILLVLAVISWLLRSISGRRK